MTVIIWIVVILFLLAAAGFITWLWRTKNPRLHELGDRFNLMLNASMLVLTIVSILIALAAFHDAKTSGDQQQRALESSRLSLEQAVQALQMQIILMNQAQDTLRSQLELSRHQQRTLQSQLSISTAQNKRELERLSRKPQVHFLFGDVPEQKFSVGTSITRKDAQFVTISIFNVGSADLDRPNLTIKTVPNEVHISSLGPGFLEGRRIFLDCGIMPQVIEPVAKGVGGYQCHFALYIPDSVSSVSLTLQIHGSNMPVHEAKLNLAVTK